MKTEFLISLIFVLIYIILKTRRSFHMLQQNWYDKSFRYFKWNLKNLRKSTFENDLFLLPIILICSFLRLEYITYILTVSYFILSCLYFYSIKHEQVKKKLVYTARLKRLTITMFILFLIPIYLILNNFQEQNIYIYYLIVTLMVNLIFYLVALANRINMPVEKIVYFYYLSKAKNKINGMTNMKRIGITGSYGKTTSKNVLNDILSTEFNSMPTPKNFNTPYGLMVTINNYLDKFNDIFIAEMGTLKRGDIKKVVNIVNPQYGILTKIGLAHLETLGSQENIQKEKFTLIESLPKDGIAVLNKDDELQVNYKLKNQCRVIWIGIDNETADVRATNIKLSHEGSSFDCIIKGNPKVYHFTTKLLGKVNIYNILAGIALGLEFGIKDEKLEMAVRRVKPTEHRLELKKYKNINIIDDAYNSNPVGSKMAVEVLGLMPGKKIIVTPGMIDLGPKQDELNTKFGEYIAEVADEVVLVGENTTKPILKGLTNKKYDKKKIHIINDVKLAFPLVEKLQDKETYVLLENDLPDIFNEK
ncbi:MAG: UDP-N-acetylmuramoyl-tripeptide--D-alanyl-D-alanine ligase [Bacilli bacterium]|nr:UDP-N-acetylmuramoyl-tripeptide--D-alanyl-D-alanine ligase [Bacilli bacterium]